MVKTECDICSGSLNKPLLKYDHKLFPCRVSMCPSCGLVKLNPRWSEAKYKHFYEKKYDFFYRGPNQSMEELFEIDLSTKGQKLRERLEGISLPDKIKMLDVGAGTGFSFFSLPEEIQVESFARESSKKCVPFLESKDVTVLGNDFSNGSGQDYDLVVARHVLEHLTDPIGFLKKISESLSKEGYLYLVVPNAMYFNSEKAHSFFRHIHTYYFNLNTLLQACQRAGLYPKKTGGEGEIWAILQREKISFIPIQNITSEEQFQIVNKYLKHSHFALKNRIKAFLKRVLHRAF